MAKINEITNSPIVYVDMDGVLANFFGAWAKLVGVKTYRDIPQDKVNDTLNQMIGTDFFAKLPKFPTTDKLIQLVEKAGRKFERHCRIDTYIVNDEVYLGEFTFFCGAQKHSKLGNMILGSIWLMNPDDYSKELPELEDIVPDFYNNPIL